MLERYWTEGDDAGIRPDRRNKVRIVLSRLDSARIPEEMDVIGFGFDALEGNQAGRFAVWVSHDWRITFSWDGNDAVNVEMEDYHGG